MTERWCRRGMAHPRHWWQTVDGPWTCPGVAEMPIPSSPELFEHWDWPGVPEPKPRPPVVVGVDYSKDAGEDGDES